MKITLLALSLTLLAACAPSIDPALLQRAIAEGTNACAEGDEARCDEYHMVMGMIAANNDAQAAAWQHVGDSWATSLNQAFHPQSGVVNCYGTGNGFSCR